MSPDASAAYGTLDAALAALEPDPGVLRAILHLLRPHSRPTVALDLADIGSATVRLHWTDQPYVWHVNDGPEVFVVLDGAVDVHYRVDGEERIERLTPGRVCCVDVGDEHVAHPDPEARILVIESAGSI